MQSLRDRFLSLYPEFVAETKFENKCRLLLDLFKLQIVFAGGSMIARASALARCVSKSS